MSQNEKLAPLFSKDRVVCYARRELERGEKDRTPEPGELRWVDFDLDWRHQFS